jgi:hypothetical protein
MLAMRMEGYRRTLVSMSVLWLPPSRPSPRRQRRLRKKNRGLERGRRKPGRERGSNLTITIGLCHPASSSRREEKAGAASPLLQDIYAPVQGDRGQNWTNINAGGHKMHPSPDILEDF